MRDEASASSLMLTSFILPAMDTITLTADLDALAKISAFVTEAAELAGLDERATWQVQLAVDEAATNVIQHAYDLDAPGDLTLGWRCEDNKFVVTLRDYGRQFDPGSIPEPDITSSLEDRQVGGLGLYLITRLMDEVRFDFDPHAGNVLTMFVFWELTSVTSYLLIGGRHQDVTLAEIENAGAALVRFTTQVASAAAAAVTLTAATAVRVTADIAVTAPPSEGAAVAVAVRAVPTAADF